MAQLKLPAELGLELFSQLEAENSLAKEAEGNAPGDLEWLAGVLRSPLSCLIISKQ